MISQEKDLAHVASTPDRARDAVQIGVANYDDECVSVVIPCYNEERFIGKALENLANQYEKNRYEIIVVDGLSEDRTREVVQEFKRAQPEIVVRILDNPARNIPAALNLGIRSARGEIIARMDAHAVPSLGYVRRCVEVLRQNATGVVGMPCQVRPGADTLTARAVAMAVSHPFGIGDAKYRLQEGKTGQEAVDTVAFSCFRKQLWKELGGFNEELLTNEDYDFNYRVRQRGGRVLLDRAEHCDYFARATLGGLAGQYFRYGQWKARMLRLRPRSIRLRHLVAPLFVTSIIVLLATGLFWRFAWAFLAFEIIIYFLLSIGFGLRVARKDGGGLPMALSMLLVFFTIHWSWGSSFLAGLVLPSRGRK